MYIYQRQLDSNKSGQPTTNILAMSSTKSDIASRLDDATLQIVKHITKLYLYRDRECKNHWKKEIYNFLHVIPKIKGKNNYPAKTFIFKYTFGVNEKYMSRWIENVTDDYGAVDYDTNNVIAVIRDYFDFLSTELAVAGDVSKHSVYNKLDEICNLPSSRP